MNDREMNALAHARLADLRAAARRPGPGPTGQAQDLTLMIVRAYATLPRRVIAPRHDRR